MCVFAFSAGDLECTHTYTHTFRIRWTTCLGVHVCGVSKARTHPTPAPNPTRTHPVRSSARRGDDRRPVSRADSRLAAAAPREDARSAGAGAKPSTAPGATKTDTRIAALSARARRAAADPVSILLLVLVCNALLPSPLVALAAKPCASEGFKSIAGN